MIEDASRPIHFHARKSGLTDLNGLESARQDTVASCRVVPAQMKRPAAWTATSVAPPRPSPSKVHTATSGISHMWPEQTPAYLDQHAKSSTACCRSHCLSRGGSSTLLCRSTVPDLPAQPCQAILLSQPLTSSMERLFATRATTLNKA